MRKRLVIAAAACAAAGIVFYAAPFQGTPSPVSGLFPAGASLYLEAKDFGAELDAWNGSAEQPRWLASARYQGFARSTLFLRLQGEWQAFSAAAGFVPDAALVKSVAGRESGLAVYSIGKLEFLYITRLAGAQAMQTALWQSRAKYEMRKAGSFDFYVRLAAGRTVAFAAANDCLVLGTREELVAGALRRMDGESLAAMEDEGWYKEASAAAGAPGELRMVWNLEALVKSPQFRSYWIQRNASEVRNHWAGISDLNRTRGEFREERVFLRRAPGPAVRGRAEELLRLAPDDAAFCRVWANPEAGAAAALIEEKVLAPKASSAPRNDYAPVVEMGNTARSEADLETRIDEPPVARRNTVALGDLQKLLTGAQLESALVVQSGHRMADGVFVDTPALMAFEAAGPWDGAAVRNALSAAAASLWTTGGSGTGWVEHRRGARTWYGMDGLGRLDLAADGNLLLLANSEALLGQALDRIDRRPAVSDAVSVALFRHAAGREDYRRMMTLLEPGAPEQGQPPFFSQDLWSLSDVFADVREVELRVRDTGALLRERVSYRLR